MRHTASASTREPQCIRAEALYSQINVAASSWTSFHRRPIQLLPQLFLPLSLFLALIKLELIQCNAISRFFFVKHRNAKYNNMLWYFFFLPVVNYCAK